MISLGPADQIRNSPVPFIPLSQPTVLRHTNKRAKDFISTRNFILFLCHSLLRV